MEIYLICLLVFLTVHVFLSGLTYYLIRSLTIKEWGSFEEFKRAPDYRELYNGLIYICVLYPIGLYIYWKEVFGGGYEG